MDDDFLSLMDDSGETRDDLKCPDSGEVADAIRGAIEQEQDILVSEAMINLFHVLCT